MNHSDQRFHVIVLSNFAKGFDKYAFAYGKAGIPESTYPDRFHLLTRAELGIGIGKARRLLDRLAIPGDRLLVLETMVDPDKLVPNVSTGLGMELHEARIRLSAVHELDRADDEFTLRPTTVEDAMAASLQLHGSALRRYADTRPRSVSLLPVASACQARCSFCFSSASISSDQAPARVPWEAVAHWLERARAAGAERAVITGGGEPTLIPFEQQLRLISACSAAFPKVVLITNGHTLAKGPHADRAARLAALSGAGLSVLAVSRHHQDDTVNERLMMLRTPVSSVIDTWREERDRWPGLRMRLICVLQHGGVADAAEVAGYLSWAAALGVEEVCFKELYVSTSTESLYFDRTANVWSREHQVSLSIVTGFAERHGFALNSRLPWGAPVYDGSWDGRPMRIAAYTEPSLLWERTSGIARSWNVMADGRCYASLEDRASEIVPEGAAA
ncbi:MULTISPECIES: radical SAM protein [unclassified Streptomyces]|uniref:radical SAM protein n=1 Tax=unclassified Streptomyces TaxID=2593676 RepID=UPI002E762498|nr:MULTISPECIES: radical SAM protein [unclassified Streptomyces]MEE1758410.1 radical SAM protein [Streptomyces sp. SP18BB07]MEE1836142.1 radical SAM protein [Streptomyces sp. SP17KL33]